MRHRMLATINSVKHYIPVNLTVTATSGITQISLVEAQELQDVAIAQDVRSGAVVKAVYVELWMIANHATSFCTFTASLEKIPAAATAMTFAQSQNLTDYPNKKNVLYTTQGIVGSAENNAVPFFRGWFKIPKGKQRMGLGDQIVVNISAITVGVQHCGMSVFKEYF